MAAYLVVMRDKMIDPAGYAAYGAKVGPTLAGHEVRPLVMNGAFKCVEGEPPHGVVVLEFPTVEAAEAWYFSPEYQAVLGLRLEATEGRAVIVEGVPAPTLAGR